MRLCVSVHSWIYWVFRRTKRRQILSRFPWGDFCSISSTSRLLRALQERRNVSVSMRLGSKAWFLAGTFHEKIRWQLLLLQIWKLCSFINLLSAAVWAVRNQNLRSCSPFDPASLQLVETPETLCCLRSDVCCRIFRPTEIQTAACSFSSESFCSQLHYKHTIAKFWWRHMSSESQSAPSTDQHAHRRLLRCWLLRISEADLLNFNFLHTWLH